MLAVTHSLKQVNMSGLDMFQSETCQDPQIRCELAQVQTSDLSVRQVGMVLPLSKALVIRNRNLVVKMKTPQSRDTRFRWRWREGWVAQITAWQGEWQKRFKVCKVKADSLGEAGREDYWTRAMMSQLSLIVWESGSDVKTNSQTPRNAARGVITDLPYWACA